MDFFITTPLSQFANSSLFFKSAKYLRNLKKFWDENNTACLGRATQVQHGMGPPINLQKLVFLPLWDNYELHVDKVLHTESFSAIKSESLVRIVKFFV